MEKQLNLVQAIGSDGKEYAVRPMIWTLDAIQQAWDKWSRYHILSDELPKNADGFGYFVVMNGSIWFEVIRVEDDYQIGLIYLNNLQHSLTTQKYIQAHFHAVMWDAKVSVRRLLGHLFLRKVFQMFGFHRLQAEIPLKFGGAIRTLKRLGFVPEGTLRRARRYNGEWYNVAILGILEDEVNHE